MTDWNDAAMEFLIAFRGGLPLTCDFCQQPYGQGRYPIPEEAGEWTCNECLVRWARASKSKGERDAPP